VVLIAMLLAAAPAGWVHAQSGDPPSQASSSQTTHIVQRGETLFTIAQQYGLTVDAITHANAISDPRQVYVGQQITIPGTGSSAPETVAYLVQAGDTLASIARRYRTTWQTLVQANRILSPNTLYVGQIIQVPLSGASSEETAQPGAGDLIYVMRPGDTAVAIALRYGISTWTLATMNHITSPALFYPGQELLVPGAGPGLLPLPFSSVEIRPLPASQGMTLIIAIHTTETVTLSGRLFEREVPFAEEEGVYYALVGVYVFTEPGLYELELNATNSAGQTTALTTGVIVGAARFGYERVDLPASQTSLLDPDIVAAETERLNALRGIFSPERRWTMPFQRPCAGVISSYFGAKRAYNDGPYTSYHAGMDFRAPGGTPVYAPAGGTIVLAEPITMLGNAIVVDHGWGLLTGYWHLSSIEVQVGQQVAAGDLIGKVGSTGLSTGAHLHWEMWVGGTPVDSLQWLEEFYPWPGNEHLSVGG
jgi:murein DD-endopeptidase MepM/ murein hydrolase activator NlpD